MYAVRIEEEMPRVQQRGLTRNWREVYAPSAISCRSAMVKFLIWKRFEDDLDAKAYFATAEMIAERR